MRGANSLEKTLLLGKVEGGRRRGRQMMRQLDAITDSMDMSLSKLWEIAAVHGAKKSWIGLKWLSMHSQKNSDCLQWTLSMALQIHTGQQWCHPQRYPDTTRTARSLPLLSGEKALPSRPCSLYHLPGLHHWLNGHEFEQGLGDCEGQGSLVCCSPGVEKSRARLSEWTTNGWTS